MTNLTRCSRSLVHTLISSTRQTVISYFQELESCLVTHQNPGQLRLDLSTRPPPFHQITEVAPRSPLKVSDPYVGVEVFFKVSGVACPGDDAGCDRSGSPPDPRSPNSRSVGLGNKEGGTGNNVMSCLRDPSEGGRQFAVTTASQPRPVPDVGKVPRSTVCSGVRA